MKKRFLIFLLALLVLLPTVYAATCANTQETSAAVIPWTGKWTMSLCTIAQGNTLYYTVTVPSGYNNKILVRVNFDPQEGGETAIDSTYYKKAGGSWIKCQDADWCVNIDVTSGETVMFKTEFTLNCFDKYMGCDGIAAYHAAVFYCGDGSCAAGETCSTCPSDCGSCGGTPSPYCGDGNCDSGETCSSCSSDCGSCSTTKKSNGQSCTLNSECTSNYCSNYICTQQTTQADCMDNYAELGEDDESCHNLVGWYERSYPDQWMTLNADQSLDLKIDYPNKDHKLIFAHYNGGCDDSFEVYVGGSKVFSFDHSTGDTGRLTEEVTIPASLITSNKVTVTFKNLASDTCGRAGIDWVKLEKSTTPVTTTTKKSDGESCTSSAECESGWCKNYKSEPSSSYKGTCCKSGEICCNKNIMDDCSALDLGLECGDNYYCIIDTGRKIGDVCVSDENCKEAGGKCDMSGKYYGHCIKKTEPTPTTTGLSIVTSISPANDPEGLKIKKLIEEDIYPILISIFDENSDDFFTGPRKIDTSINLVMTFNAGEASWDEKTNILTIPYASKYKDMGNYKAEIMQINALAHELVHYHFNGRVGGDYNKVPAWFREGLAEYGAHAYYKRALSGKDNSPPNSVAEYRETRFGSYLEDKRYNYKETWKENGIKKVSWKKMSDMNTNLEDYDHIYYGATFSFIKYLLSKDTYKEGESMMDVLKYMFAAGADGDFAFYAHVLDKNNKMSEQDLKTDWIETFEKSYDVNKLDNEPRGILYRLRKFWNYIFRRD